MALEFTFTCPLPNGVHARPASALEEIARRFASTVTIGNQRTGQSADATSVLGLVGLAITFGDPCRIVVSGQDEREAFGALTRFLRDDFARCDEPLPAIDMRAGDVRVPRALARSGAVVHAGTPVVAGIGIGRAVGIGGFTIPAGTVTDGTPDPEAEARRIDTAITALVRAYDAQLAVSSGPQAGVLRAQRAVARDPEFRRRVRQAVLAGGRTAAGALADAEAYFTAMLAATGSALLLDRALDVRDVCLRLLRELYGAALVSTTTPPDGDWVSIAESLTPSQFLALDRRTLRGLVLVRGGSTSHTVILARSFGIPTLVGLGGVDVAELEGQDVVVDADLGALVSNVTEAARRYYHLEQTRLAGRRARLERVGSDPATTADGRRLEVGANVGSAAEVARAVEAGAEGIGLFRTELLFQGRTEPPSEQEQFEEYRRALEAAADRPVIIRTLDVGGDKPVSYMKLPAEENPFLGYRAVRTYPEFEEVFRCQVRALVRASTFGRLKVMVPMVSSIEEILWVKHIVAEEQRATQAAGRPFDAGMPLGAMIEVPALAFLIEHASVHLDFFSVGTNDLLQYAMAVDRSNPTVAALYNPMHPGFLQLLRAIVTTAHRAGRWVGLCGEMGGQPECLPLLVGLGLDEISMSATRIAATRSALARLSAASCVDLLDRALACPTASDVSALVSAFDRSNEAPLFEADLIALDVDARSKDEAIKAAADRLYAAGRTESPRDVEEAVWAREAACSTGFGHGFAVPHARTDAVRSASLVFVRLRSPVDWGSLDDKPVEVVLLLTLRASDAPRSHLQILAALSRSLMHGEFRERLRLDTDAGELCAFLRQTLQMA